MKNLFLIVFGCLFVFQVTAQEVHSGIYSVDELFQLVLKNNQALRVSRKQVELAKQNASVVKSNQLPSVDVGVSGGYIGDAHTLDKDFSNYERVDMPHVLNTFALQASMTVFQGHLLKTQSGIADLQTEISGIDLKNDLQDVKLLVVGHYLDLFKLHNQKSVYLKNIQLAHLRLVQLKKFYDHGMVTRNEIIRSELQLADLKLSVATIEQDMQVLNRKLTLAAGLPDSVVIRPDSTVLSLLPVVDNEEDFQSQAAGAPSILKSKSEIDLAQQGLQATKSGLYPSVSAFATNNLARPIMKTTPVTDEYSTDWEVGLKISYSLSSLYKTRKKVVYDQIKVDDAREKAILTEQKKEIAIKKAFVDYKKAVIRSSTLKENMRLADENYRIIEKKYLNQLALNIDMLDASNEKLQAELDHTNAEINVLYSYYQLKREIGQL